MAELPVERLLLSEVLQKISNAKTKAEKREEKETQQLTQPETDKPTSKVKGVKKNITKQKIDQIAPSKIGIQKVREELINARNKTDNCKVDLFGVKNKFDKVKLP